MNRGHLLNSIRWALAGPDAVTIGSHLEYAAYHQFGIPWHASRQLGGLPARPFLDVEFEDDASRRELDLILSDWVSGGGDLARRFGARPTVGD